MKILLQPDQIYMIRRKDFIDPRFFLFDVVEFDSDLSQVVWTPNIVKGREFYSEESVETFMFERLRDRPCEIILVK